VSTKKNEGRSSLEGGRSSLEGIRVVNTRSPKQAPALDALLEERGARSLSYPCIGIAPALDSTPLDGALARMSENAFDWLVFTSANAVEAVRDRLDELRLGLGIMKAARVAAVGPGTAAAVAGRLGVGAELCPEEYVAEALADSLVEQRAERVFLPQAEKAREALVRILEANGIQVEAVVAYRTVLGSGGADVPRLAGEGRLDAVAFASPSAVDNMAARFEQEHGRWDDLQRTTIACIGSITSAAAERQGLKVQVMAEDHTIPGLVDGLERYYQEKQQRGQRAT
jgi:uroporphyrinogen-III synthase